MKIVGLMSGTSLDGLDIALCEFSLENKKVIFEIIKAETIAYNAIRKAKMQAVKNLNAENYFQMHAKFGQFLGKQVIDFLLKNNLKADAIASHGHTIFHQPNLGFSTQLGCGATIAATTGITTVCDFRTLDVALGGQGAPLVPFGDKILFGDYEACLNIGGIANISFEKNNQRVAYDICEANMVLNYLAEKLGMPYDKGGQVAKQNKIHTDLLNQLNHLDFYKKTGVKSLAREWFEEIILPIILKSKLSNQDLISTFTEHIGEVIANELNQHQLKNLLVTGGGAFNHFLIERIKTKTKCEIILPSNEIINFKEALIFAFLGYLRLSHQVNTLASVTGASANSIGGAVYLGYV